jgi:hypothetical protein
MSSFGIAVPLASAQTYIRAEEGGTDGWAAEPYHFLYTRILVLFLPPDRITDVKYVSGIHRRVVHLELFRGLLLRTLATLARTLLVLFRNCLFIVKK